MFLGAPHPPYGASGDLDSLVWPQEFTLEDRNRQEDYLKGLALSLWECRNSGDFVLDVRGERIATHSCLLAAASPIFKAMLELDMREKQTRSVNIDADPADVLAMLRFAYTGEFHHVSPVQLPGVLQLAHKYEITDLIPHCCSAMIDNLTVETAVPYVRTMRLLEGTAMELPRCSQQPSRYDHSLLGSPPTQPPQAGITALFGAPAQPPQAGAPSQPQVPATAGAQFFNLGESAQPTSHSETNSSVFFGGAPLDVEPPAAAIGPGVQVWPSAAQERGSRGAMSTTVQVGESSGSTGCSGDTDNRTSPIAHAFVTIGKLIAANPEIQMAVLRSL